jgi:hypothetical protein
MKYAKIRNFYRELIKTPTTFPKNYQSDGNVYTYGKAFNCLGHRYQPLTCFYSNDRIDYIYDIRTWLHYKKLLKKMLVAGYVFFEDFHIQQNRVFNHPEHLVKLYRKFHEDENFYNDLNSFLC